MYVPSPFEVRERAVVYDLIEAAPFATVVTADAELAVSHLPVSLQRPPAGTTSWGTLRGHVARGNAHWRLFDGAHETLVVFHGPHAYVSPRSYADTAAPPTWNYAVVHAYGRPLRVQDEPRKRAHLDELVSRFETQALELSEEARQRLEQGIVAFELEIERIEAKFKLGQNRTPADRAGTVAALEGGGDLERQLAALTRRLTGLV